MKLLFSLVCITLASLLVAGIDVFSAAAIWELLGRPDFYFAEWGLRIRGGVFATLPIAVVWFGIGIGSIFATGAMITTTLNQAFPARFLATGALLAAVMILPAGNYIQFSCRELAPFRDGLLLLGVLAAIMVLRIRLDYTKIASKNPQADV